MALSRVHSKNLKEMTSAIDDCLKAERHIPALVLMYSLIDSLSWVESGQSNGDTRGRFENWVSQWLLPNLPPYDPKVTATDLYAARCAMLHTGTGISDLMKSKKAKRLMYAWGAAKTEVVQRTIAVTGSTENHAVLHCDALFSAIRKGLKNFVASAKNDSNLTARFQELAAAQYGNVRV